MNPKDIQGEKKPPLHLIPLNAKIVMAMAMRNGAHKYGPANWREEEIQASAYVGAADRHISLWYDCMEENAKDSGVHHLGHAMATLGILYDALVNEQLVDDRPTPSKASELMDAHTVDNKMTASNRLECTENQLPLDTIKLAVSESDFLMSPEFREKMKYWAQVPIFELTNPLTALEGETLIVDPLSGRAQVLRDSDGEVIEETSATLKCES